MDDYFKFIKTHFIHLKSKQGRLIPFASHHISRSKKKIGIVGLNSAWMCRKASDKEKEHLAIGEYQIKNAFMELKDKELGELDLAINVFHHPLGWLWNVDERACRTYFKTLEAPEWLEQNKAAHPHLWNERTWRCPNAPVVGVTWYVNRWLTATLNDGFTYRLPEEGEWEDAASGFERRENPWGDDWDKLRCNNGEIDIGKTSPVGIFFFPFTTEGGRNFFEISGGVRLGAFPIFVTCSSGLQP